jgi:hypothetical protein
MKWLCCCAAFRSISFNIFSFLSCLAQRVGSNHPHPPPKGLRWLRGVSCTTNGSAPRGARHPQYVDKLCPLARIQLTSTCLPIDAGNFRFYVPTGDQGADSVFRFHAHVLKPSRPCTKSRQRRPGEARNQQPRFRLWRPGEAAQHFSFFFPAKPVNTSRSRLKRGAGCIGGYGGFGAHTATATATVGISSTCE